MQPLLPLFYNCNRHLIHQLTSSDPLRLHYYHSIYLLGHLVSHRVGLPVNQCPRNQGNKSKTHVTNGKNDDDDDDDRPFYQQPVESYSTTIIVLGMTKLMKWENPQRYPWQNPLYPQWLNCMAKPMKWENPQRYPWQNPLHRQRLNCMAKPMTWEIPLGCYGKSHGIKISILNVGGQCHQGSLMLQNQLFWPIFHYY